MPESINVMIALQTPDGLAFGYVLDASPRHVAFTVNGNLHPGVSFAWRMELQGYAETIMGRLTVEKVHPARSADGWPRYEARIDEIPPEDGALLAVWMEDQEKGGSSRRLEKDPSRFVKDMFSEGMRGASSAQTKLVIERMNERSARREQMFKKKKQGVAGDFGLSRQSRQSGVGSSVSSVEIRSRISSALGSFSRKKLEEAEPEPKPRVEAVEIPPTPERANPTDQADEGTAPAPDTRSTQEIIAEALRKANLPVDLAPEDPGSSMPIVARPAVRPGPERPAAAEPPQPERPAAAPPPKPERPAAAPPPQPERHAAAPPPQPDSAPASGQAAAPAAEPAPAFRFEAPEELLEPMADEAPPEPVLESPPEPKPRPKPKPRQDGLMDGVHYDDKVQPARLDVVYPWAGDFASDYRNHMHNMGLFLTGHQIGSRGDIIQLRLVSPSGPVECKATVVVVLPGGTGLQLDLNAQQMALLAAAAANAAD